MHIRAVHEKKYFQYHECTHFSATRYDLEMHIKCVHEGIKLFTFPHCNHETNKKGYLKVQLLKTHESSEKYDF